MALEGAKLRPLGDRLIVKAIEQEEVTSGGILLPETAKEKPQMGMVIAIGPGQRDDDGKYIPMDVKVDDRVLFAKYAGTEVKLSEENKLLVLKESDVLAIVE